MHLVTGVTVGLVVVMMSLTGVLLTYEHQLVSRADAKSWPSHTAGAERLSVEKIAAAAEDAGVKAGRVTYFKNLQAPVLVGGGRRAPSTYVDAYTGRILGRPKNATRDLMRTLTAWHRWFATSGEGRDTARFITGASNLAFLFLLVTGAYLWLPKMMRWPQFRERLRFAKRYRNSKNRDFYWHHIFAAWSFVPLLVIIVTAVVISFDWAHDILTGIAGESSGRPANVFVAEAPVDSEPMALDDLLQSAMNLSESWNSIAVVLPSAGSRSVNFIVDAGSGRQPQKKTTIVLDAYTGVVISRSGFADQAPRSRAIATNRFLHTGEWFGVVGQTIAGLVSMATLFMVWTGLALAWRRLISPLLAGPNSG